MQEKCDSEIAFGPNRTEWCSCEIYDRDVNALIIWIWDLFQLFALAFCFHFRNKENTTM